MARNAVWQGIYEASAAAHVRMAPQSDPESGFCCRRKDLMAATRIDSHILETFKTQQKQTLVELSSERPLLLVFLRHFG
jgi:hypothetical protein